MFNFLIGCIAELHTMHSVPHTIIERGPAARELRKPGGMAPPGEFEMFTIAFPYALGGSCFDGHRYPSGFMHVLHGAALTVASFSISAAAGAEVPLVPQRVLWIVSDSMRQDHLGFSGYERDTSPYIDSLAAESVAFQWAISAGNMTHISVPAYFTGRYFSQLYENPLVHRSGWLPVWPKTIAEAFQAKGFKTLAWSTNIIVTEKTGCARGFDSFSFVMPRSTTYAKIDEMIRAVHDQYTPSGKSEFIYVHLMDCHLPYQPPYPYDRMFSKEYTRDAVIEGALLDAHGEHVFGNAPFYSQRHDMIQEDLDFLIGQYDGTIRHFDDRLRDLLEALDYDPARDMLMLFADHGDQFFEHGYWGHGHKTMPEETRVPLIVRWDGFPARAVSQPVSLLDLYSTCAGLFGFDPPFGSIGQSLVPLLRGGEETERYVYSEFFDARGAGGSVVGPDYLYYLNTRTWYLEPWRIWPVQESIYDLRKDPACATDLFASAAGEADRLNALLRAMNPRFDRATPDKLRGADSDATFGANLVPVDAEGHPAWQIAEAPIAAKGPALQFSGAGEVARLMVDTPDDRVYLLEFDYTLEHGVITVDVQSKGRNTFHLELAKPEVNGHSRFLVVAGPPQTEITATVDATGTGSISGIRFSSARIPMIGLVPWKVPKDVPPAKDTKNLDSQERAVLRALGYAE